MKKIAVTVPYGAQITEDRYIKRYITRVFDETSTVSDILNFVEEVHDGDISSAIITTIK